MKTKKAGLFLLFCLPFFGWAQTATEALKKSQERGLLVYEDFCMNCHMANGEGVAGVFPPLAKSDYLKAKPLASIRAVKFGMTGEIKVNGEVYNGVMTPLGLTDQEIADVMNYINTTWGNETKKILSADDVTKIEKAETQQKEP